MDWPVVLRNRLERRRETESVVAVVAAVAQYELLLRIPRAAYLAHLMHISRTLCTKGCDFSQAGHVREVASSWLLRVRNTLSAHSVTVSGCTHRFFHLILARLLLWRVVFLRRLTQPTAYDGLRETPP